MATRLLHRDDPYCLDFEARVVARLEHEGRPAVVLDQTAFYAESGGQPSDTGRLGEAQVVAVFESGPDVVHVLDATLSADHVRGSVDGERRLDHRQQHHGQHLLSRALLDLVGARTLSFHLGREVTTIDLDRPLTAEEAERAERRVNEVIQEARPVRVRTVPRGEAASLGLSAPPGEDLVRLVEAEGFDLQPCGGTHPRTTAEVGCLMVTGLERYKGGTRVTFLCGQRALRGFRVQGDAIKALAGLLSAPPSALPEAVRRLLDQAQQARRDQEAMRVRALGLEAEVLFAKAAAEDLSTALIVARFDDRSPDELQGLAQALVARGPCLALLGAGGDRAHLVFAQTPGLAFDVPGLLKQAVELVGGRGGGRGDLARGGGDRVDRLDAALAHARQAARPGP